jgi:argininosuccinate lyase
MKLWDKGYQLDQQVETYTVGDDYLLDRALVRYDCLASIAHAAALRKAGVLTENERRKLVTELRSIIALDGRGEFKIAPEDEDGLTAIEKHLMAALGDLGKKIHTARSRNDQVVAAIRLYCKDRLAETGSLLNEFITVVRRKTKSLRAARMPGYTHARKAMPSTFSAWLDAWAESLGDDNIPLKAAGNLLDQNPLGTGAGYGIPVFKLDRRLTAKELGFRKVQSSPIYVQNSRGKFEAIVVSALADIMFDMNKICTDLILFSMDEFGFVRLPRTLCTGSSIMPQKLNPDVLEIARGHYHTVVANEFRIRSTIGNLMSGYNRDLQLTKKPLMESFDIVCSTLRVVAGVVEQLEVDEERCRLACTPELYATEEAFRLVKEGMPFRDAYRVIAERLQKEKISPQKR